jgi:hypothetical protein
VKSVVVFYLALAVAAVLYGAWQVDHLRYWWASFDGAAAVYYFARALAHLEPKS